MSLLLNLPDDRRAAKPWLPDSDRDVTEGRVVRGSREWDGRPDCVQHGAMQAVAPPEDDEARIYRCMNERCGVGAIWYPTNSRRAKIEFRIAWDKKVK